MDGLILEKYQRKKLIHLQFGVGVLQKEAICQSAKVQTALWKRGFQLNALQNSPVLDLHHRHYLAIQFANPNTLIRCPSPFEVIFTLATKTRI